MSITEVTVPVPSDRLPDFYRWFADWVEAPDQVGIIAPDGEDPLEAASRWWSLLTPRERRVFGLWIEEAPNILTASSMVERLGLNGPRDIPGILSWPSRKGKKAGFEVHWTFRRNPASNEPLYGIENMEYAELIRRARASVEGQQEQ